MKEVIMSIGGIGENDNVSGKKGASSADAEKVKQLNFEKLRLGNIFSIAEDGDEKVGIGDIKKLPGAGCDGLTSESLIKLLIPYIKQGATWTQAIIDDLANKIAQINPNDKQQQIFLSDDYDTFDGYKRLSDNKTFVSKDGTIIELYNIEGTSNANYKIVNDKRNLYLLQKYGISIGGGLILGIDNVQEKSIKGKKTLIITGKNFDLSILHNL